MKDTIAKLLGGALLGSAMTFGATGLGTDAPVDAQKKEITKDYIYAQVRLNEVPTIDISVTTPEEYTAAIAELAAEKGATEKENLFDGLHDQAVAAGVACN